MDLETVIGLEIHAQLLINTKIFCGCSTTFGAPPNTHGCPVCLGMPGSLPVLNREAVNKAIRMGVAVGCAIAPRSVFARKNYLYPDLPKGYQISQYDMPLCENGTITVTTPDGGNKGVRIKRIHLEEDAGKLIHDQGPDTLFDVNRCGTPLIEIVTEPDMESPAQAYAYFVAIKRILEYLGVCDCNMEEGSLRCDANISLRPRGQKALGTKAEIKNMNTFRGVEKALEYEIKRQTEVLCSGGTIVQQTCLWDPDNGRTIPMRDKENAHDYRYFPDPDLVPLIVDSSMVEQIRGQLPELPQARCARFVSALGLTPYAAGELSDTKRVADYFEAALAGCTDAKLVSNWVMTEVLGIAKERKCDVDMLRITPARLAVLLGKMKDGTVSAQAAKKVLDAVERDNRDPVDVIKELGLEQVSDVEALEQEAERIIAASPKEVERYKGGDARLLGFFVGQIMKATRGKGNPAEINRILKAKLG